MYFIEEIPLYKAKYILSLPNDVILNEMFDKDEMIEGNGKFDYDTYIKGVKSFCKRVVASKGEVKQSYKFSNRLGDCGRQFVKGFGIQSLQHKLRGFLCSDNYVDLDMINAHPTILKWMVSEWFPDKSFPHLFKYCESRAKLLVTHKASKRDVLISMNSDKKYGGDNVLICNLDKEFKGIQKLVWDSGLYSKYKTETRKNPRGSFLNTILCIIENDILSEVMQHIKISVPMFDGFLIHKDDYKEDIVEQLNNISKKYDVKWTQKPHDPTIQLDEDLLLDLDIEQYKDYDTAKIEFEEDFFVIDQPLGFGEITNEGLYIRSKVDFQTFCENKTFFEEDKNNKPIEKALFPKWIKDKDRRHYRKIDFIPRLHRIPPDIYNTFDGFQYMGNSCPHPEAVKIFLDHLDLLVNHDEKSFNYLCGYIAHLFQKSDELPEVALLFKSQQGVGKDLMIDILQKILGNDMVYRTAKLDEIFDKFNGSLKNRLLLQLNEVQGCDGFAKKENLKDLITTKSININEKNLKPYTLSNYMRVIIFSNNLSPIEIPHDDRRYCVFKCGKKQSRHYYNRLVSIIDDGDALESILNHFINYNLKGFDIKDRPITKAYEDMQQSNVHPLYEYLYDTFICDGFHDEFDVDGEMYVHKKLHKICVTPRAFREGFRTHLECIQQTYIKHDFKTLKLLLGDLGIYQKQLKFSGKSPTPYFIFPENPELLESLESKGFTPQEIEILE